MKKIWIMLLVVAFSCGLTAQAYASDWDKAGIALTGIEGLRVITGGKVDLVGSMFGLNRNNQHSQYARHKTRYHRRDHKANYDCTNRVWVPHYVWKKKYIPKHEEYSKKYGKIMIGGHYIKYKVEKGGHWETKYSCLHR